ncbi:DUF2989 domain-containing protein [Vibrio ostreicida]|uniref:DUF2989 domain-containing protein n=1 Tax=Vibrio ostreicida TaxID=526588 RepID=UPI003B5BAA86
MNNFKVLFIISLALALSGCFEGRKNTQQLCEKHPQLQCERMNLDDGQCRVPRTDLIWHRFEVFKQPTPSNLIKEYHLAAAYKKCLELASQIQPIQQPGLKQKRFDALVNSGDDLESLVVRIRESSAPEALYFLWSQTGDDASKRSFLQLEGTQALNTAEMQYALATFYTSRDQEKTLTLLNKSLELGNGDNINLDIFKSLASINYQLGRKEQAYVWAMVTSEFDEASMPSLQETHLLYGFSKEKYAQLDDLAGDVESAISKGRYNSSLLATLNKK